MSELSDNLKRLKYDKRMINWNLKQKVITKEDYKKHLLGLEDLSDLKEELQITEKKENKAHQS